MQVTWHALITPQASCILWQNVWGFFLVRSHLPKVNACADKGPLHL